MPLEFKQSTLGDCGIIQKMLYEVNNIDNLVLVAKRTCFGLPWEIHLLIGEVTVHI